MKATNRLIAALIGTIALLVTAVLFTVSANAAPYSNQAAISVSTTTPAVGANVSFGGSGYTSGERVSFTMGSFNLGSVAAGVDGTFNLSAALPAGISGTFTIVAVGATSGRTANITITIGGATAGGTTNGATAGGTTNGTTAGGTSSGSGGDLASTGVAVVGIGALGVALLVGGGFVLMAGKRRRVSA
jgi:hypothetical protein